MIDQQYIDTLMELPKREAKDAFVTYASEFGIELKKNLTIEAMVEKFKEEIGKLNDEPLPESEPGGLTMAELLAQEDSRIAVQASEDKQPAPEVEQEAAPEVLIAPPPVETIKPDETPTRVKETQPEAIQEQSDVELPADFTPKLSLIGPAPGYTNIPYWVWDFIQQNPDWKSKIHTAREVDQRILYTLLYYIKRHKAVQIRESRNSRFHTLN